MSLMNALHRGCIATACAVAMLLSTPAHPAAIAPADTRGALLDEFMDLLAIPNVASNLSDMERNAAAISKMMERRGLHPRLLRVPGQAAPPGIYGEWRVPGASKTYVLYAHYDGQPADPADWIYSPPFTPVVRTGAAPTDSMIAPPFTGKQLRDDWRIFARAASDDKLGVIAILAAVDRLRAAGQKPSFNLKIFFEGEEEAGSDHLSSILKAHENVLKSDGWVIFDGPAHPSGAPQVVLGVRGVTSLDVTVFGPVRPLHSGHYGNWAPDPALRLAQLLATMEDRNGRVTIPGFYEDMVPLSPAEKEAIARIPDSDRSLAEELGLARPDGGNRKLAELLHEPSLDILGIRSADVGAQARNVIPAIATATLGLRLVKGDDPDRQIGRIIEHIRAQGYFVTHDEPTMAERRSHPLIARVQQGSGYAAERTPLDHPFAQAVIAAVAADRRPVVLPTLGGSLPLHLIGDTLHVPTVTVSNANHDNNQHAENENLRLGNLWMAIDVATAIMKMR